MNREIADRHVMLWARRKMKTCGERQEDTVAQVLCEGLEPDHLLVTDAPSGQAGQQRDDGLEAANECTG